MPPLQLTPIPLRTSTLLLLLRFHCHQELFLQQQRQLLHRFHPPYTPFTHVLQHAVTTRGQHKQHHIIHIHSHGKQHLKRIKPYFLRHLPASIFHQRVGKKREQDHEQRKVQHHYPVKRHHFTKARVTRRPMPPKNATRSTPRPRTGVPFVRKRVVRQQRGKDNRSN